MQILDCGDYTVEMDAGSTIGAFRLDSSLLNGTDTLNGQVQWFDVTTYVQSVRFNRGRRQRRDQIDAGQITIRILDNGDFSVVNSASPYWNTGRNRLGFEPARRLKVSRDGVPLFTGFIVSYNQELTMDGQSYVTVQGADDLKRLESVTIDAHVPTAQRTDERLAAILDRDEVRLFTGSGQRVLAEGLSRVGTQAVEQGVTVREYVDRVNACEFGRIFFDGAGRFVFEARTGRQQYGLPILFSDQSDGNIPFQSFEVVFS